jgi:hypothetical protein
LVLRRLFPKLSEATTKSSVLMMECQMLANINEFWKKSKNNCIFGYI